MTGLYYNREMDKRVKSQETAFCTVRFRRILFQHGLAWPKVDRIGQNEK